ncbi:MAG: tetratricopeptide repeat protein, partial [Rhodanobacter sp.]
MLHFAKRNFALTSLFAAALLAGCATPAPVVTPPPVPTHDMVAAIRAAGEREQSIIDVTPLSSPGVTNLQNAALADERAGHYVEAAAKLDQALQLSPDSPDLLQDRAEVAVRLKDYSTAERLAHRSG